MPSSCLANSFLRGKRRHYKRIFMRVELPGPPFLRHPWQEEAVNKAGAQSSVMTVRTGLNIRCGLMMFFEDRPCRGKQTVAGEFAPQSRHANSGRRLAESSYSEGCRHVVKEVMSQLVVACRWGRLFTGSAKPQEGGLQGWLIRFATRLPRINPGILELPKIQAGCCNSIFLIVC